MFYLKKDRRIITRISIVVLCPGWLESPRGLEVVEPVVHVVVHVGSVPVAHHVVPVPEVVTAVPPVGVVVGLIPGGSLGLSIGLGVSGPLVVEGSVLGVAGSVPVVVVHVPVVPVVVVHVPVVVVHGPVVSPVGVSVGPVPGISLRLCLSGPLAVVEPVSLLHPRSVPVVVHVPAV